MRGDQQRWVGVGEFHGGGLATKNELGIHVGHWMPGGEEHGDVAARVHDNLLFASSEPPAFEQGQHLAARVVDVDDAAAIGDASIVQCPLDLLLVQFSECPCRSSGHSFPSSPLGFLKAYPSDRMIFPVLASGEAVSDAKCLQVRIQEFCQDSCATAHSAADAGHDVCQGQDSCSFQGARAAKSGTGRKSSARSTCGEEGGSKKDGSALFAKRRHCTMVQLGLTPSPQGACAS